MKKKLPFYLLMIFVIATIVYIFVAPIMVINKIEKDSKRPKSERIMK